MTILDAYKEACNYPGKLDEAAVEHHLRRYLDALGVTREVRMIRQGWSLESEPALGRYVGSILRDFASRAGRPILDARDARDALDAFAASDARDAVSTALTSLKRFAAWCIQTGGWWCWGWELSVYATTYFGARELKHAKVEKWSKPLLEAFVAGAWTLYWTDDTLFWTAKPTVHRDPTPGTRQLHNENYAALESDVENLYFWHGVLVPAFVVVRPDWITVTHIDSETNAEVRRVMIERYKHGEEVHGAPAFMRDAGGKSLDHDEPIF